MLGRRDLTLVQNRNKSTTFCTQWKQLVFHWKDFIPHSLLFQSVSLTIPLPCETMADTSSAIVVLSVVSVETYSTSFMGGPLSLCFWIHGLELLFFCCFKNRFPRSKPCERALRCKYTTMTSYRHLKKKFSTSTLSCHVQQISKTVDIFTIDLVLLFPLHQPLRVRGKLPHKYMPIYADK